MLHGHPSDFVFDNPSRAEIWYRQAAERATEPEVRVYFLSRAEECRRKYQKLQP